MQEGFIPKHGGYQCLLTYPKAAIIYDATTFFCRQYVPSRSRTNDQMVQAARSGKQNIVEASMASGTSRETEIKLTNVARASLEELLEDYRDFLRAGGHELWDKNSKAALAVRRLAGNKRGNGTIGTRETRGTRGQEEAFPRTVIQTGLPSHRPQPSQASQGSQESQASQASQASQGFQKPQLSQGSRDPQESYETYRPYIESRSPQTAANVIICLIHQTTYLLARQIKSLEASFVREGGLRESMTRARLEHRNQKHS